MVAPREFQRIARIVLQRLSANGGHVTCESAGPAGAGAVWRLWSPRNAYRKPVMDIPARAADAMAAAGWLRGKEGRWMITEAGRAWLARARQGEPVTPPSKKRLRREIVDPDGVRRHAEISAGESPLDWLARRKDRNGAPFLSPEELAAGERLRRDYEAARLGQKITASWDAAFAASERRRVRAAPRDHLDAGERALAARQKVRRALAAAGPGLDDILLEVCCLSRGLESAERRLGWPRRSARLVLRIALDRLARHYGLKKDRPAGRAARVLSWGIPGHVPEYALPRDVPAPEETEKAEETMP